MVKVPRPGLMLAATAAYMALCVPIEQLRSQQTPTEVAEPSTASQTVSGAFGERQVDSAALVSRTATKRISNRIEMRAQNRLQTRIDRSYEVARTRTDTVTANPQQPEITASPQQPEITASPQ